MKNKKNLLKMKLPVLLAFCLFLYPPTLKSFPVITDIAIYCVPLVYLFLNRNILKEMNIAQYKIIFFALLLVVISCLVPLLHDTNDFSYLYVTTYFFRKLLAYLFLTCLVLKKHGKEKLFYYLLYYFILTHAVYVAGTLVLVLLPSFKEWWFSIFSNKISNEMLINSYGYTFRIGWNGFAGFRLTLYCTISAVLALYLAYGAKLKIINAWQLVILFLGCLLGNMFYGRIGLIVTIIASAIAIIVWNRKYLHRIILGILVILAFLISLGALKEVPIFSKWYDWMSKPIINLISTGDFNNASFDRLQEMTQVEMSSQTMLFGDGYYEQNGEYYKQTDSGYIRNILFWGIFGAVLSYGLAIYGVIRLRNISKLLLLQFLFIFLAFEYKGPVYYEFIPLLFVIEFAFGVMNLNDKMDYPMGKKELEAVND